LDIAVIVLARPNEPTLRFDSESHQIVDQAVLIGELCCLELLVEFVVIDRLEDIFEPAVVFLEDGVLGREVNRQAPREPVIEAGSGKTFNRFVQVLHP